MRAQIRLQRTKVALMLQRSAKTYILGLFTLTLLLAPKTAANRQAKDPQSKQQDDARTKSKSAKTHFARGNQAMHDAQAIRQQLEIVSSEQKPALLARMKATYQTAIAEYEEALQDTKVRDENSVVVIGLIGLVRNNGLVSKEKAVDMLVRDKDLPVIMSNLGMAYGGLGQHEEAIKFLKQSLILSPAANTYMELGTDLAHLGKLPEATAACNEIPSVEPRASDVEARCDKNIAIVLMNAQRFAEACGPLKKAAQLNPQDAGTWKLLGDAQSASITTASEGGKIVYIIPPGTVEAYQKYLLLEPDGLYATQVQAALDGLVRLAKNDH